MKSTFVSFSLLLFAFLLMSTVTVFDEAYAHHPSNQATLTSDKLIYLINDTITLTCIVENGGDPKDTRWGFSNAVSPQRHPAVYSFPASDFGLGEYDVFCHNHPLSDYKPPAGGPIPINHSEKVIFFIVDEIFPIPDLDITPAILLDIEINDDDTILLLTEPNKKSGNGSCNDCTPPTIGLDKDGVRYVDGGLKLNGVSYNGDYFKNHMNMQYTEIGKMNHLHLKVYENSGAYNIDMIQFGIVPEIGSPINNYEPRIEIDVSNFANDVYNPSLDNITLIDKKGIIDNYDVTVSIVQCMEEYTQQCLQLDIYWTFAKVPEFNVLLINGWDNNKNSFNNYFNDGLTTIDPNYVEPQIIPPYKYECEDPSLDSIQVWTRTNCNFAEYKLKIAQEALEYLESMK